MPACIVFGANITALAVMRSCGRAGVPVYNAGSDRTTIGRSRWFRPVPGVDVPESASPDRVADLLRALPFDRSVLFPCSDHWALALAALPSDIVTRHTPVTASLPVVQTLVDKEAFAHAAAAHGVPAPRQFKPQQLSDISDSDLPNFFIKPRDSQLFSGRFGVKAFLLTGRANAEEMLGQLAAERIEVVLQELIPGGATDHVFLDGYVDRRGAIRACFARRRLRMYPRPFGNSTLSVTIPMREVAAARESLERLYTGLGFVGLFDAEFAFDARDGLFKIVEVNGRPWWQLALSGGSGLDVCVMAYHDALGEPFTVPSEYRIGRTWVHPIPDLSAWWDGVKRGDRTGGFPVRNWFTGPNTVCTWDDPWPVLDELGRLARITFRKVRRTS
ncbi:MAG TPA: hypothetical protein VFR25_02710 [Candidatus Eisenbacteria bacterium]|nr:hypothetical protein [Candidatus Eisenbacteria bacterium]